MAENTLEHNPINFDNIKKEVEIKDPAIRMLEDKIRGLEATNTALKGMLKQFIPVVQVFIPILKEREEVDQQMVKQIETLVNVSSMLCNSEAFQGAQE